MFNSHICIFTFNSLIATILPHTHSEQAFTTLPHTHAQILMVTQILILSYIYYLTSHFQTKCSHASHFTSHTLRTDIYHFTSYILYTNSLAHTLIFCLIFITLPHTLTQYTLIFLISPYTIMKNALYLLLMSHNQTKLWYVLLDLAQNVLVFFTFPKT